MLAPDPGILAVRAAALPWYRVPPARSPVSVHDLVAASRSALGLGPDPEELEAAIVEGLKRRFDAVDVVLTGSGTSALTLALSAAFSARGGRRVGLPAYTCYSVGSALVGARGLGLLYDLEPETVGPAPESVEGVLRRGVDVLLATPLHGFPIDVPALMESAHRHGALVVEDAAQGGGGTLRGRPSGAFAPLSTLSFGRGKGVTCGAGGAVVVRDPELVPFVREWAGRLLPGPRGWGALGSAAAEWALGRPEVYGIPAALPFLGLGETRFHPPAPLRGLGIAPRVLLGRVLEGHGCEDPATRAADVRRERATELAARLSPLPGVRRIRALAEAVPGALRFPFLMPREAGNGAPRLGVMPGYPSTLADVPALRPFLDRSGPMPGANELVRFLLTAPTHPWAPDDLAVRVASWARRRIGCRGGRDAEITSIHVRVPA